MSTTLVAVIAASIVVVAAAVDVDVVVVLLFLFLLLLLLLLLFLQLLLLLLLLLLAVVIDCTKELRYVILIFQVVLSAYITWEAGVNGWFGHYNWSKNNFF